MAEETGQTRLNLDFCKYLRTKRYYFSDAPPATYLSEHTATTGYWCLRTMGPIGPDDGHACPGVCGAHRSCYRSNAGQPV